MPDWRMRRRVGREFYYPFPYSRLIPDTLYVHLSVKGGLFEEVMIRNTNRIVYAKSIGAINPMIH